MSLLKSMVLWLMALVIFTAGSNIGQAYTITGHAECQNEGWVPFGAVVRVYEVDPLPGGAYTANELTLTASSVVDENGDFTITTGDPYGSGGFEVGGPDLLFVVTQNINSAIETIYQESYPDVHWNIADGSTVEFTITSAQAVCYNPAITPDMVPNNNIFLFTRVGSHYTDDIDCKGSDSDSEGYYRPKKAPYNFTGMDTDMPYGSTLDLFGWLGQTCNIDYYKVLYLPDGAVDWIELNTNLPNRWYDMTDFDPQQWHWVSESMGPVSVGLEDNLYKIPHRERPGIPWAYIDRIASFDTRLAANGACRIKVTGYKMSGSEVVVAVDPDIVIEGNFGEIVLQIDNTPPIVEILAVKRNGSIKQPCDILEFGPGPTVFTNDTITVEFRVWDQRGHLRDYVLEAMYGHNQAVSPRPAGATETYEFYPPPSWQGGTGYFVDYVGTAYSYAQMPTCAYQFRLHAGKRTTNGYGRIYKWVEDTWHVTVKR